MDGLLPPLGSPRKALGIISVCVFHKLTLNYRCKLIQHTLMSVWPTEFNAAWILKRKNKCNLTL